MGKTAWRRKWTAIAAVALMLAAGSYQPNISHAASSAGCGSGDFGLLQKQQKAGNAAFSDIRFLNAATGRAAGSGFLLGTSNGGCQWQEIYTGQWQFEQIDFPTNVYGWALARVEPGQTSYLIRSVDGGSHWKRLDTGIAGINRIDFLDSHTGFAYTRAFTYKTTDGGAAWVKIPTPANTRGASFSSLSRGWAVVVKPGSGYQLMKTTDGGKHWTTSLSVASQVQTGGDVYDNGSQVWALLYGDSGMSQASYSLYAGGSQGTAWHQVFAQSTAGGGPAPGSGNKGNGEGPAEPGGHPGNMQLTGSSTAFLAAGSGAAEKVGLGRSMDAGKTWRNLPTVLKGYSARISFTDSKTGWLAVTDPAHPNLYVTHDGGATWSSKFAMKPPAN